MNIRKVLIVLFIFVFVGNLFLYPWPMDNHNEQDRVITATHGEPRSPTPPHTRFHDEVDIYHRMNMEYYSKEYNMNIKIPLIDFYSFVRIID